MIFAGDGDDLVTGFGGADFLDGGDGFDTLVLSGLSEGVVIDLAGGAVGAATVVNFELVTGSAFDDILTGGGGADSFSGGGGDDAVNGGAGDDSLDGGSSDDMVSGGDGADQLTGGSGDDQVFGDAGEDIIDGGSGDDLVEGGSGNDSVFGGSSDDSLFGGSGDDLLDGGAGNDVLVGGAGNDQLLGGSSNDIFVFGADGGADTVQDFDLNDDQIDVTALGLADLDAVLAIVEDTAEGALLAAESGASLLLVGIAADALGEANFLFAAA